MNIYQEKNNIIIENCEEFDLVHTFECGQCFRWNKLSESEYAGVHNGTVLRIGQADGKITLYDTTKEQFESIWKKYFDLERNYKQIQTALSCDSVLARAIPEGRGIRILAQNPFETIISFIISANNNIPRIKLIIERLCESFGEKIELDGKAYYSFPNADTLASLSREDLAGIKAGFRDKYIIDAAKKIASGEVLIDKIFELDYETAKNELKKIKGVGEKVANCILLFGFGKLSAFPVDVWIRRILEHYYFGGEEIKCDIEQFAKERFGELGGFAQQYLFYYARENKIAK